MKNGEWRYCSGWGISWVGEFSKRLLLNISMTLKWIGRFDPKNGWYEGPMVIWPVNRIAQPDSIMMMEWNCHVQEWPATNEVIQVFFPFPQVIADWYLFIFVKLEEDNIWLFYNFPFGKTCRCVLISLATVKLILVCMDKFVAIVLTSLTTKITQSF